jgi:hypothetical protein
MSKIEVDAITEQSGTTLTTGGGAGKTVVVDATTVTLGRCGGTVALASGASQTGFGRTGTVDWNTTPKTTGTFSAVSGDGFFLNTSGGVITANLPAGVAGAIVSFADYAGTWQTNNVTVTPNGTDKIGSVNSSVTLDTEGQSVTFVFVDSTQGWINTMDSTSNVRSASYICASVSGSCNTLTTAPCGNVKIAKFLGPGTFTVNTVSSTPTDNIVSHLIVAGGGGGAAANSSGGGGGGAGGYREVKNPVTPYTASPIEGFSTPTNRVTITAQAYAVVVGGGGAGGTAGPACSAVGARGVASSFGGITSAGGGAGSSCISTVPLSPGGSGGGVAFTGSNAAGNVPPVSPAQGTPSGVSYQGSPCYSGSGGGGATVAGGRNAQPQPSAGIGGTGTDTQILAAAPFSFSGGGGGGASTSGPSAPGGAGSPCGTGGAGKAARPSGGSGDNGMTNHGGGGGGSGYPTTGYVGGNGGSGIVVIRYKFQ